GNNPALRKEFIAFVAASPEELQKRLNAEDVINKINKALEERKDIIGRIMEKHPGELPANIFV
ncbi:MAG: hypothetical protein QW336_02645, partial [Candidatus Anstonellales archaeon]